MRSSQQGGRVLATPHREARRVPAGKPARGCGPPLFSNPPSGVSARQPSRQMALGRHLSRCLRGPHRPPWPLPSVAKGGSPTGSRLRCAARPLALPFVRGFWSIPDAFISTSTLGIGTTAALLKSTPSPGRSSRQCLALTGRFAGPAARCIVTPHGAGDGHAVNFVHEQRTVWVGTDVLSPSRSEGEPIHARQPKPHHPSETIRSIPG